MYKELHLSITTACTMQCPNCVYGMSWRPARHSSVAEIEKALPRLAGIPQITLTGGEPTAHPHFFEIARLVRHTFPEISLGLETNATLYPRFKPALELFNTIDATLYGPDAWPGCPGNAAQVEQLKQDFPALRILVAKHLTPSSNRGDHPCGRQARAHWSHGLVYGCCAAPGHRSAKGIPLAENWHEQLPGIKLPCAECIYGQPNPT